jgi:hypothetical protein
VIGSPTINSSIIAWYHKPVITMNFCNIILESRCGREHHRTLGKLDGIQRPAERIFSLQTMEKTPALNMPVPDMN